MKKPTLLYVSPFWPMRSGISEYSEHLVRGLQQFFDVTLLTDNYTLENTELKKSFNVIKYCDTQTYDVFEHIIYNFGNNPDFHSYMYEMIQNYPGYIILHDFVLYYLTIGYYENRNQAFHKIYEIAKIEPVQMVKDRLKNNPDPELLHHKNLAAQLPLNKEILTLSKGILVHSNYTKKQVQCIVPDKLVLKIHLVQPLIEMSTDTNFLNKMFGIKQGEYIIGSLGYIAETKQNRLACMAVEQYNQTHEEKIHYVMIGEGDYVDNFIGQYIHKTGFINNDAFYAAIQSCDLILNLRYPYNGESSATLLQCMALGKPCIVTDIGWFGELPNETVVKESVELTVEQLCCEIERLKESNLEQLCKNAKDYVVKECNAVAISEKIFNVLQKN